MNKIEKAIKKQAAKFIDAIATNELNAWPPVCALILYQPERPQQEISATSDNAKAQAL